MTTNQARAQAVEVHFDPEALYKVRLTQALISTLVTIVYQSSVPGRDLKAVTQALMLLEALSGDNILQSGIKLPGACIKALVGVVESGTYKGRDVHTISELLKALAEPLLNAAHDAEPELPTIVEQTESSNLVREAILAQANGQEASV